MPNNDNNKVVLKFWIVALAFSVLMLATTFAVMASYLADIKETTLTALTRTDMIAEKINTVDAEVSLIHHHIIQQKMSANAMAGTPTNIVLPESSIAKAEDSPAPLVKDITPAEMKDAVSKLPSIQSPAISAPSLAPAVPPVK